METDYLDRIIKNVKLVVRLGRKRKCGFIFASQLPNDISKDIVNLCQTKLILGLENEAWVSNVLGSKYIRTVTRFSQGDAFIHCVDFHEHPIRLRIPRAPCEHEMR